MKWLAYVRMVLWSFCGIGQRGAAREEAASAKPLALLATAFGLVLTFALVLWSLVQLAVTTLR